MTQLWTEEKTTDGGSEEEQEVWRMAETSSLVVHGVGAGVRPSPSEAANDRGIELWSLDTDTIHN